MKPSIKQLKQAKDMLDSADVPTHGRFYRYMNENGDMIEDKTDDRPTLGSLFPCLRGKE